MSAQQQRCAQGVTTRLCEAGAGGLSRRATLHMASAGLLVSQAAMLALTSAAPRSAHAADVLNAIPLLPAEVASELAGAQPQGSARLRFLGLDIYEARLWTPAGFVASAYARSPFALELNYARSLSGRFIAERSLKEMRRQGSISAEREQAWLEAMVQTFPDVKAGDRITGLHTPGVGARFWFNGQSRPAVPDSEFSRTFFGIWLSDATSEPQMRSQLLTPAAGPKAP
jgi:hypothetical protein